MTGSKLPTPVHPARPNLTIVTPCFNEAAVIGQFIEAILGLASKLADQCSLSLLVVDDGSTDATTEVLADWVRLDARVTWLGLSRNFGHQAALSAGIDYAPPGAVLLMDSDMEHPPSSIPEMVRHWLAGTEIVSAVRLEPEGLPWWKTSSSTAFYRIFNRLSDTKLPIGAADFVLLSARARTALRGMPEYHRFLRAMVAWVGFSRTFVPYEQPLRPAGSSKYTLRRMLRLATHGVLSFSTRPIYVFVAASLCISGAGGLYLLYVFWMRLVAQTTITGWSSIMAALLLLGGWQTLVSAFVGLYVAKILEQVKGRPIYIVRKPVESHDAHQASGLFGL